MTRRTILALPVFLAAGAERRVRLGTSMRLSFAGLGPVRIGMTETQIRDILLGRIRKDAQMGSECYYLAPDAPGLGLMMMNGHLERIDVYKGRWRALSGVGIGSTDAEVKDLYSGEDLRVEPHKYEKEGKNLVLIAREDRYKGRAMIFETDGQTVTRFRTGLEDAVRLVEGCS